MAAGGGSDGPACRQSSYLLADWLVGPAKSWNCNGRVKALLEKKAEKKKTNLVENKLEITDFTRTANKNSAITQRGKAQISCHHECYLFLSWCALKASCAAGKEEMIVSKWFSLGRVCGLESVSTCPVSPLGTTFHVCSPSNSEAEAEGHLSQESLAMRGVWTIFWVSA